ncbi:MAG TPA: nitroreductase family protein [Gemmatimonadaceae bacterium]|jgi:nitroreductase|nr:nitroreductase family protein [Gemmatimonadaceae bacterium]
MRINPENAAGLTTVEAPIAADSRRSVRHFAPEPVPEADLIELLRLAARAPSAFNAQPWRFVVVRDEALKEKLAEAAFGQQQVLRAPATIVIYSDMADALERMPESMHPDMPSEKREAGVASFRASFAGKTDAEREAWGAEQSNIALGYLLLLAESFGLGTSPMLGFDPAKVKAVLGLPEHARIPALVAIGYPGEEGFRPHRLPIETLVQVR